MTEAPPRSGPQGIQVALEASTRRASVAIARGDHGPIHQRALDPERAHASDLLPALDALLAEHGAVPTEVELVAVGLGPGSYTGVRVAVALAQGIALGGGALLIGVPSIRAELYEQLEPGERGTALRDARGGRLTLGTYRRTEADLEELHAPAAVPPDAALPWLTRELDHEDAVLVAEPGLLEQLLGGDAAPPPHRVRPLRPASAGAVLHLGRALLAGRGPMHPRELAPLYLAEFVARPRAR